MTAARCRGLPAVQRPSGDLTSHRTEFPATEHRATERRLPLSHGDLPIMLTLVTWSQCNSDRMTAWDQSDVVATTERAPLPFVRDDSALLNRDIHSLCAVPPCPTRFDGTRMCRRSRSC